MILKSIATILHDPKADFGALEYAIQVARKWAVRTMNKPQPMPLQ